MIQSLQPEGLPLVGSGGVFLIIVGAAMLVGALRFPRRYLILGLGVAAGSIALAMLAIPLSAPHGPPSPLQLWSLAMAVLVEIVAIVVLMPRAARHGERAMTVTILAIVGAHFLIMFPAFGPLIVALGLASLANALVAGRARAYPLPALWAGDGALKAAAGVAMFLSR